METASWRVASSVIVEQRRSVVQTLAAILAPVNSEPMQCATTQTMLVVIAASLLQQIQYVEQAGVHVIFKKCAQDHLDHVLLMLINRMVVRVVMLLASSVLRVNVRVETSSVNRSSSREQVGTTPILVMMTLAD